MRSGKYGIISFAKETILEPKYDEIKGVCGENAYVTKENGKYSLINKDGEKLTSRTFNDVLGINKDYVVASNGSKYGVLTLSGENKIDFKYDELKFINNDYYIAKSGDKYGVVRNRWKRKATN